MGRWTLMPAGISPGMEVVLRDDVPPENAYARLLELAPKPAIRDLQTLYHEALRVEMPGKGLAIRREMVGQALYGMSRSSGTITWAMRGEDLKDEWRRTADVALLAEAALPVDVRLKAMAATPTTPEPLARVLEALAGLASTPGSRSALEEVIKATHGMAQGEHGTETSPGSA